MIWKPLSVLQTLYCLCFYLFTAEKVATLRGIVGTAVFVVCLNSYIHYESDVDVAKHRLGKILFCSAQQLYSVLGLLSSTMSVCYCAAPLASVLTVVRTRSTESLPFYLIIATIAMTSSWSLYGLIIQDTFVIVPNTIGCIIAMGQIMLFTLYPTTSSEKYVV